MDNLLETRIGNEYYAFDADVIDQVLRIPPVTPVPLGDGRIRGVSVLFGRLVTVVDTAALLDGDETDLERESARLLTMEREGETVGFCVDSVEDMIRFEARNYEGVEHEDVLIGFYKKEDRVVQVLDPFGMMENIALLDFSPEEIDTLADMEKDRKDAGDTYEEMRRLLFFRLDEECFAIDVELLRELIFVPENITKIARSDTMGLITLRDELLTMLDMHAIVGIGRYDGPQPSQRCLIAGRNGRFLALLVDEIEDVRDIPQTVIETIDHDLFQGIVQIDDGPVSLIDPDALEMWLERYTMTEERPRGRENHLNKEHDMTEMAVFKIGDEEYAFDIEGVQEIIRYQDTTPLPDAPPYIDGVINLRGSIIPIFSLPDRLTFDLRVDDKTKIIVCPVHGEKVGFVVDEVDEILFVEDRFVTRSKSDVTVFDEIVKLDEGRRVILKLDADKLIDEETIQQLEMLEKSA